MTFDGGGAARKGTISQDCARIEWAATGQGDPAQTLDDCRCNGTTTPDSVEVRMIHDFLYIGQAIAANLTSFERKLMTSFFGSCELRILSVR